MEKQHWAKLWHPQVYALLAEYTEFLQKQIPSNPQGFTKSHQADAIKHICRGRKMLSIGTNHMGLFIEKL